MSDIPVQDQETRDLIGDFVALCLERANREYTTRGNELALQMQSIAKELIRRGAETALLKLTESANTAVKYYAAESYYDVSPDVTRRVFESIFADESAGFFRHLAKIGLMVRYVDFFKANRTPMSAKEKEILDPYFALLDEFQLKLDKSSKGQPVEPSTGNDLVDSYRRLSLLRRPPPT